MEQVVVATKPPSSDVAEVVQPAVTPSVVPSKASAQNSDNVVISAECEGLSIPRVGKTKFEGLIPVWSFDVKNDSNNRYNVKVDVTFRERVKNYFGVKDSQYTEEKSYTVRANTAVRFMLSEVNLGGGREVLEVKSMDVFECR